MPYFSLENGNIQLVFENTRIYTERIVANREFLTIVEDY